MLVWDKNDLPLLHRPVGMELETRNELNSLTHQLSELFLNQLRCNGTLERSGGNAIVTLQLPILLILLIIHSRLQARDERSNWPYCDSPSLFPSNIAFAIKLSYFTTVLAGNIWFFAIWFSNPNTRERYFVGFCQFRNRVWMPYPFSVIIQTVVPQPMTACVVVMTQWPHTLFVFYMLLPNFLHYGTMRTNALEIWQQRLIMPSTFLARSTQPILIFDKVSLHRFPLVMCSSN